MLEQKLADESAELVRDFVARGMAAATLERIAEFERLTAARARTTERHCATSRPYSAKSTPAAAGTIDSTDQDRHQRARGLACGSRMDEFQAAGAGARRSPRRSFPNRSCCCWTSPPIISTSVRSSGLETAVGTLSRRRAVRHPRSELRRESRDADRRYRSRQAAQLARRLQRLPSRAWAKSDEEEDRQNALFDKKLAEEEVWIRKGVKARRTRNEGRVERSKSCASNSRRAYQEAPRGAGPQINDPRRVRPQGHRASQRLARLRRSTIC